MFSFNICFHAEKEKIHKENFKTKEIMLVKEEKTSSRKLRFWKIPIVMTTTKNIYFSHLTQKLIMQVLASLRLILSVVNRDRGISENDSSPPKIKSKINKTQRC